VLLILGALTAAIWVYLYFFRGCFWRVRQDVPQPTSMRTRIVAVVPARNEADNIAQCVKSLLSQADSNLHVILIDDHSTDETASIARAEAEQLCLSERLTIISGAPLPPGWTGKLWAVQQGIQQAAALNPDFLLLTDADIDHGRDTTATLVSIAERERADLTSFMVKLRCESIAEKLLIPAFVYFFFQLYPPAWIGNSRKRTVGAAGGGMLVRPEALQRAGGIEAIRAEIIDDCALAKAIRRSGGRVWLGVTESSRSLRSYGSFGEVGRMISRTAFNQLRHSALLLAVTIAGMSLVYAMPLKLLGSGELVATVLGTLAFALMVASYLPMVRFYRLNHLWALTLPLAALFYMGATIWSAVLYWTGRGGQWKGRAQDSATAAAK